MQSHFSQMYINATDKVEGLCNHFSVTRLVVDAKCKHVADRILDNPVVTSGACALKFDR